jgi:hypothetical protein
MTKLTKRWRGFTPAHLAATSTAVVFAAAFTISWESLRVLALAAGIRELLAPLYPLTIDAVMVTGTVAAVALRAASLRTRLYTWVLIAAGIAVSVVGNAVHSQAHGDVLFLLWWAAGASSAVPALSLAASLHLLVIVLRHGRQAESLGEAAADTVPETVDVRVHRPVSETPKRPVRATQSASRRRLTRLLRQRPEIGPAEVSRRLGVSRSSASRWLSEARRPRVVAKEVAAE